jgi:hypothetical protein
MKSWAILIGQAERRVDCQDEIEAINRARLLRASGVMAKILTEWKNTGDLNENTPETLENSSAYLPAALKSR